MLAFLVLLLLFDQNVMAEGAEVSDLRACVREIKQKMAELEGLIQSLPAEIPPQTSPSDNPPPQTSPSDNPPPTSYAYVQNQNFSWTKNQELRRLKDIEEELIENPLGAKPKRLLKQFALHVKNETVKAEALFFLGEVYYLRQKLTGGKKNDNKKALGFFSRSYSLDPNSSRTPKALVRVAQCLAKDAKYEEAQSILQKIKAEHGKGLGFDLEQEYNRVLEVCRGV